VKPGLHWYTPEVTFSVEFFEMHGPPFGPEHHASQTQSVMFSLPTDEFELSGQRVHAALPFVGLYVPGTQFTHAPPFGPVKRVLHRQSVTSPLRASAAEFAGHIVQLALASAAYCSAGHILHVILLSAATVGEYVPIKQFVQFAEPFEALCVPATHATHDPPFGPVYPVLHRQFVMSPLRSGAAEFAGHTVHFALACGAYSPAAHIAHVVLLSAATLAEYVPIEQFVQYALPFEALCVPGRQALHLPFEVPLSGPVYPELHEHCMLGAATGRLFSAQQSVEFTVPERDLYPAGHDSHDKAAVTFENESAAHTRHGEASGAGLNEPFGQDTHAELLVSFRAYPALQVLQDNASEL